MVLNFLFAHLWISINLSLPFPLSLCIPHHPAPPALTLTLYSAFCAREARASLWHEPCSCKTNNDWDLCGLSILSPFQFKTLKMPCREGTERGETSSCKVGGGIVTGGRCPTLRGCTTREMWNRKDRRNEERGREAPCPKTHYMLSFFVGQSSCILSKHIIQAQECTYSTHTHTFVLIQVNIPCHCVR